MMTEPTSTTLPGLFICLEGPDGGGKTTQAARLVEALQALGQTVVACRDPGGTALGDQLRSLLLEHGEVPISCRAEMLLYMASRAQLVEEVIRPALRAGASVVSDRFLLSNVVYQGYAGGLDVEEVWSIGKAATGGLLPDLTVLIDVPPEVAQARVGPPRDRIEDRGEAYRERVRAGFLKAAESYPGSILVLDGAADPETVGQAIWSEVQRALEIDSRS